MAVVVYNHPPGLLGVVTLGLLSNPATERSPGLPHHPHTGPLIQAKTRGSKIKPDPLSTRRVRKLDASFQEVQVISEGVLQRKARRGVELAEVQLQYTSPTTKSEVWSFWKEIN